jgi:hypothetical protein
MRRRKLLVREAQDGITKRDTLPNFEYPLKDEAEAVYFKKARDFLQTSLFHRIIECSQDICGGK